MQTKPNDGLAKRRCETTNDIACLTERLSCQASRRRWRKHIKDKLSQQHQVSIGVDDVWQEALTVIARSALVEWSEERLSAFIAGVIKNIIRREVRKLGRDKRGGRQPGAKAVPLDTISNSTRPLTGERVGKRKRRAHAGPPITGNERFEPDSEIDLSSMLKHEHASKMTPAEVAERREEWDRKLRVLEPARLRRIALLKLRNMTPPQIASELGRTTGQVEADVRKIQAVWRERGLD